MTEKSKSQIAKQNIFIVVVLISLCGIIANTNSYFYKEWHDSHWQKLTTPLTLQDKRNFATIWGCQKIIPSAGRRR
ncbi:MAG: hypothetical protein DWQ07_13515 [Chloroflexi bacterium]|nr:MAG: hypothetical protein DWQ07_13515 [Chloroflexota bacterium]MBL1196745.1 hypothetical protein [Chloroflexota bacterium]NOH14039.1 hypothetical protein [Chloroflexota bacterium]